MKTIVKQIISPVLAITLAAIPASGNASDCHTLANECGDLSWKVTNNSDGTTTVTIKKPGAESVPVTIPSGSAKEVSAYGITITPYGGDNIHWEDVNNCQDTGYQCN